MPRVPMEAFADRDVEPIFIAANLREAQHVEERLTQQGIEFAVEVEPFVRYMLDMFPLVHAGATFYVLSGQSDYCRRVLVSAGLSSGLIGNEA